MTSFGRVALLAVILAVSLVAGTLLSAQWIEPSVASADEPPAHAQVDEFLHAS